MGMMDRLGGAAGLTQVLRDSVAEDAVREVLLLSLTPTNDAGARLRARLLGQAIAPLRESRRVRLFDLPGGNLAAVVTPPAPELDIAASAIAAVVDDPAAVRLLKLPRDAALLLAAIERGMGLDTVLPDDLPPEAPPLDEAGLASLERSVAQADLSPFLRCQTVCRIAPGKPPEPLFEDRHLPDAPLIGALTGQDATASPELARRARAVLEARLLAALYHRRWLAEPRPVAVRLLPETLSSAGFRKLAAAWPRRARRMITLVLPIARLIEDLPGGAAALDIARNGSWGLALDAAGPSELRALPADALGIGFVRVPFSPELLADAAALSTVRDAEVWLSGADRAAAIAWGWERGLRLFQGRLVEKRRG